MNNTHRYLDDLAAGVMLLFGLWCVLYAIPTQTQPGEAYYGMPPSFFPTASAAAIAVLAAGILGGRWIQRLRGRAVRSAGTLDWGNVRHLAVTTAALVAAGIGFFTVGYLVAAPLIVAGFMLLMGGVRWPTLVAVSLLLPWSLYAVLWLGLGLRLP